VLCQFVPMCFARLWCGIRQYRPATVPAQAQVVRLSCQSRQCLRGPELSNCPASHGRASSLITCWSSSLTRIRRRRASSCLGSEPGLGVRRVDPATPSGCPDAASQTSMHWRDPVPRTGSGLGASTRIAAAARREEDSARVWTDHGPGPASFGSPISRQRPVH
jgi:hypothetical protein